MTNSIATLLRRNLDDVFGELDPVRRRRAVEEIFHDDAVFFDPMGGVYRGRDQIHEIAGLVKSQHPNFRYRPLAEPEVTGEGGRIRWVSGVPGEKPEYAGTDFIIVRGGKIAAVYLFFDEMPKV